ncbi:MAG: type II secretion system minor pseudopilin GspH [gamma proteobacterium symbiont of Bathyaustriella thionipta]|nr:type II secretion system minor pseudopilin GspH [gamma proteobacterium symbiont of Bathyaustriella thionipta]
MNIKWQKNAGFTLIELLIVIFIIGILTGVVSLTIRHDRGSSQLPSRSDLLTELLALGQQEAIMRSRATGVYVRKQGFKFAYLQEDSWLALPASGPFRQRQLQAGQHYRLLLDDDKPALLLDDYPEDPQIIFYPSSEATPFSLFLEKDNGEHQWRLQGDLYGDISTALAAEP